MKTSTLKNTTTSSTTKAHIETTTTTTARPTKALKKQEEDNTNKLNDTHTTIKCYNMAKVARTTNCKDTLQNELNMTTTTATNLTRNHHYHNHQLQLPNDKQQQQQHQHYQHKQQNHLQLPQQQLDKMSIHSISSEDISTTVSGKCCSAAARNPAIKTGRRIQLMQVITCCVIRKIQQQIKLL